MRSATARDAWSGFVEAAVERYGPGGAYWATNYPVDHPGADPVPIEQWQVWNEPSADAVLGSETEAGRVRGARQADLEGDHGCRPGCLRGPRRALRHADRGVGGIALRKFLRAFYKTPKIERYFDSAAIHPYGPDLKRVRFQVEWARDEMKRAGDRNADLWISEIGWASDRLHNQLGVGPQGQAKMLTKMFKMFREKRSKWNIAGVSWYAWQDTDSPGFCDFCRRSGLVDVNNQRKPSYDAYAKLATG